MKYAEKLVLLAKRETVIRDVIDRLTEMGKCYGIDMNVEERKVANGNLKATISATEYDRSKTTGECGIFQLLGNLLTNDAWPKLHSTRRMIFSPANWT